MPAFTFEKIPSPVRASPSTTAAPQASSRSISTGKSRALVHAMLDRLATARLKREQAESKPTPPRKPPD